MKRLFTILILLLAFSSSAKAYDLIYVSACANGGAPVRCSNSNKIVQIFSFHSDFTNPVQLTDDSYSNLDPVVSNFGQGNLLVFAKLTDPTNSYFNIYTMPVTGGTETAITTGNNRFLRPTWAADGTIAASQLVIECTGQTFNDIGSGIQYVGLRQATHGIRCDDNPANPSYIPPANIVDMPAVANSTATIIYASNAHAINNLGVSAIPSGGLSPGSYCGGGLAWFTGPYGLNGSTPQYTPGSGFQIATMCKTAGQWDPSTFTYQTNTLGVVFADPRISHGATEITFDSTYDGLAHSGARNENQYIMTSTSWGTPADATFTQLTTCVQPLSCGTGSWSLNDLVINLQYGENDNFEQEFTALAYAAQVTVSSKTLVVSTINIDDTAGGMSSGVSSPTPTLVAGSEAPILGVGTNVAWTPLAQTSLAQIISSTSTTAKASWNKNATTLTLNGSCPSGIASLNVYDTTISNNTIVGSVGSCTNGVITFSTQTTITGARVAGTVGDTLTFGLGQEMDVTAQWDDVQFALQGSADPGMISPSSTIYKCVLAYHPSGINYVSMSLDGGPSINISNLSTTQSGAQGYCAELVDTSINDGLHEVRAYVYPNIGFPRSLSSQLQGTVTASNANISVPPYGQGQNKYVYVTNSPDGNGTEGSGFLYNGLYCISKNYNTNSIQLEITSGTTCETTVATPASSGTVTLTWNAAGWLELGDGNKASDYFSTNGNNTYTYQTVYADSVNGNNSNNCLAAGSGHACADLATAEAALIPTNAANGQAVSNSSTTCTTFHRNNNATQWVLNTPVQIIDGTQSASAPYNYALQFVNSGPIYFIKALSYGSTDYMTLSATPGGACIYDTGYSGTAELIPDLSNDIISVAGGSPTAGYTLGPTTGVSAQRLQSFGYTHIVAPLNSPTSVVYYSVAGTGNNTTGLRNQRTAWVGGSIIPEQIQATITSSPVTAPATQIPSGQYSLSVVGSYGLTTDLAAGWYLATPGSGHGCSTFSNGNPGNDGTVVTIADLNSGNIDLTNAQPFLTSPSPIFANCAVGTTLNFFNKFTLNNGTDVWDRNVTMNGAYYWSNQINLMQASTSSFLTQAGATFVTNTGLTNVDEGYTGVYISASTINNTNAAFNTSDEVLNSSATGVGAEGIDNSSTGYTTTASTSAASSATITGAFAKNSPSITVSTCPASYNANYPIYDSTKAAFIGVSSSCSTGTMSFGGSGTAIAVSNNDVITFPQTYTLNALPGSINTGFQFYPNSSSSSPDLYVCAFDLVALTITTCNGYTGGTVAIGTSVAFYDGTHRDFQFWAQPRNDVIVANSTCTSCYGLGISTQSGPQFDFAYINSSPAVLDAINPGSSSWASGIGSAQTATGPISYCIDGTSPTICQGVGFYYFEDQFTAYVFQTNTNDMLGNAPMYGSMYFSDNSCSVSGAIYTAQTSSTIPANNEVFYNDTSGFTPVAGQHACH